MTHRKKTETPETKRIAAALLCVMLIWVIAGGGSEYELGSLAYWYEGPSIALIYKASRDQTVVPVVPIGKITSDVSVFEEYGDAVLIELEEVPDEELEEK